MYLIENKSGKMHIVTWRVQGKSGIVYPCRALNKMADGPDWVGKARSKRCDLGILNRADGSARFQQGKSVWL